MIRDITKILYATDLSDNAAYALRYAIHLAIKHDAGLVILHVFELVTTTNRFALELYLDGEIRKKKYNEKVIETIDQIRKRLKILCDKEFDGDINYADRVASIEVCEGFPAVGHPKAEKILISMAASCETIEETVKLMVADGERVGLIKVRLYRPFSSYHFYAAVPASIKRIAVLDRTEEIGSSGGPLYLDVCASFMEFGELPKIVGGRYGLNSEEFNPSMVKAIFNNLDAPFPKNHFTLGLHGNVPHTSLKDKDGLDAAPMTL